MCISKIILFGLILWATQNHAADRKRCLPHMGSQGPYLAGLPEVCKIQKLPAPLRNESTYRSALLKSRERLGSWVQGGPAHRPEVVSRLAPWPSANLRTFLKGVVP